jgi:hypothetical protein
MRSRGVVSASARRPALSGTKAITNLCATSVFDTNAGTDTFVDTGVAQGADGILPFGFGSGAALTTTPVTMVWSGTQVYAGGPQATASMRMLHVAAATVQRAAVENLDLFIGEQPFVDGSSTTFEQGTIRFRLGTSSIPTGNIVMIGGVSGLKKSGLAAIRQVAKNFGAANATPSLTFPAACLTTNPIALFLVNATNPAGITPPTNFTEIEDSGYATPNRGGWWAYRNSGHTSATVTWPANSPSVWAAIGVEFDAS